MQRILVFCLLLLFGLSASGQNFQPFVAGRLHWFHSGSNYSVRIDSVGMIGNDSAFWMNEIAVPPSQSCWVSNTTHFVLGQEGLFGDHFIHGADGAFRFVNRNSDTATFHTQLPLTQPWQFLSDSTLTAFISLRGQISVLGQVDSFIVIDISDGSQYRLTEHYGMYLGPNLSYFLLDDSLRFSTIAERPTLPDFKEYFDWQPGDVYNVTIANHPAWDQYYRYEVLQRQESNNGDSLTITVKRNHSDNWIPTPITFFPTDTISSVNTRQALKFLELATYEVDTQATGYHWQKEWFDDPEFSGRKTLRFDYFNFPGMMDSCGYGYYGTIPPCNVPMYKYYTKGLGTTSTEFTTGQTMTTCVYATVTMSCYEQAGHDSLGPCPAGIIALGNEPAVVANGHLELSIHSQTGAVSLIWEGFKPGNYQWELFDLSGKLLSKQEKSMDASGGEKIIRPGGIGLCLLRIQPIDGDWVQTLRVPFVTE
jgi:hypothetical protein